MEYPKNTDVGEALASRDIRYGVETQSHKGMKEPVLVCQMFLLNSVQSCKTSKGIQ
jgi:hypothetical protein